MAWVGYAEHDEAKTRAAGGLGRPRRRSTSHSATSSGLTRSAAAAPPARPSASGATTWVQDYAHDPSVAPWRESALRHGYRSSIGLPLKDEYGIAFGALTIYSAEPEAFTPEEVRLLEELAADLAFGITVLRARAEREQKDAALRQSEARYSSFVENAPVGVFQSTLEGQFVYVNPACAAIFGCETPAEMIELVNHTGIGAGDL